MRRYYLHTRKGGIYYAELVSQTGIKLTARSTGTRSREEAILKVAEWLKTVIPAGREKRHRTVEAAAGLAAILKSIEKTTDLDPDGALRIAGALRSRGLIDFPTVGAGKGNMSFVKFLLWLWDYEASPRIREMLAHKHRLSRRHAYEMTSRIHTFYEPYFTGRTVATITRQDLKAFSLHLAENVKTQTGGEPLSAVYINKILKAAIVVLAWAAREQLIPVNPAAGFTFFSGESKKRGVLTLREAEAIFRVEWKDGRAMTGSLVAMTAGLRAGEVLGLRKSDIDPVKPVLYIRHSWSTMDGLKCPKTNEPRRAPLLPEVREALEKLIKENPHNDNPDPFIFYSLLPDQPMDARLLLDGLKKACGEAGIDCKARNIVFHSWRHFYAARLADKMTAEEVMRITGHKTRAVFDVYADHITEENLEAMGRAGQEVFGKILRFSRGA
jgi:integrase